VVQGSGFGVRLWGFGSAAAAPAGTQSSEVLPREGETVSNSFEDLNLNVEA